MIVENKNRLDGDFLLCPHGDSNPGRSLERAAS